MQVFSWFWARVRGAFNSWVERGIGVGLVLVPVVLWRRKDDLPEDVTLSRPAFVLTIALGALLLFVAAYALARGQFYRSVADDGQRQLLLTAYYSRHIYDALETLQKILTGTIPEVEVETFVEQGILHPARDFLMQRPGEDVRLSILVPEGQDFVMSCSAGHTLESKQRFRLPIADSFSRSAYKTGRIESSGDLGTDPRFTRHPKATPEREYHSIISVPIRSGDHTVGVFNVISTRRDAFEPADFIYVSLLGAIIDVVWSPDDEGGITDNGDNVEIAGTDK